MHKYRTSTCNDLRLEDVGKVEKLSGFVRTIRDLGAVMFVDLVAHYGTTQLLVNTPEMIETFRKIPEESSICVTGEVLKRDIENVNKNIETGEIELKVNNLQTLKEISTMGI